MLRLRLNTPGPYWAEDLLYFVLDEARRLPARVAGGTARLRRAHERIRESRTATANVISSVLNGRLFERKPATVTPIAVAPLAELLDEPLEWTLATLSLSESHTGATTAIALHKQAEEQLDSADYVLSRLRDELRPLMVHTPLPGDEPVPLRTVAAFETSLEALLALSRENAASRPKDRVQAA